MACQRLANALAQMTSRTLPPTCAARPTRAGKWLPYRHQTELVNVADCQVSDTLISTRQIVGRTCGDDHSLKGWHGLAANFTNRHYFAYQIEQSMNPKHLPC